MKRLSKDHMKRRDEIVTRLNDAKSDLEAAIEKFNAAVQEAWGGVESEVNAYNEAAADANALLEEIHGEQESYADERSDAWRDGDAGSNYSDWMQEFEQEVDEIDIDAPEPIDTPEVSYGADDLAALREEPGA